MESLFIQGTERTPEFNFDIDNFFIALTGHSKIKKTDSFYLNITEYIEKIEKSPELKGTLTEIKNTDVYKELQKAAAQYSDS